MRKNYPIHELELYAIVHAFRYWKNYLVHAKVLIYMNNISLNFFHLQPTLLI